MADAELDNFPLAFRSEDLTRGVVGVDDDNGLDMDTCCDSLRISSFELSDAQRPGILLIEVVGDLCTCAEGEKGREKSLF